ncbi:MAG: O-antigen ligase family protein [Bacteroidia bacterium]|nr:O-antigen ligase family protein [Bacteroidia bacterium]
MLLTAPISRVYAWMILIAGIPWASEILKLSGGVIVTLPTDLLAAIVGVGMSIYLLWDLEKIPSYLTSSSILAWGTLYFGWMGVTTLFSVDWLPSLKFWISQSAYFMAFGISGFYIAQRRDFNIAKLYLFALLSAAAVLSIIIVKHYDFGFKREMVDASAHPFMREHTIYGAYTAWFTMIGVILLKERFGLWEIIFTAIAFTALITSFSRGGWLSLLGAAGIFILILIFDILPSILRLILLIAILTSITISGVFFFEYNPSFLQMQMYRDVGEVGKHFATSFDLRQNASNLERINRWAAALQMIAEKPLIGFGPNTFVQEYSAYQRSLTRTEISVEMGEVGGAHSEYLTAASEMGIPGLIFLLGIYLSTLWVGLRGFRKSTSPTDRLNYALLVFPLISYYLHGFINNFMDHGHIAALIYLHWGLLAGMEYRASEQKRVYEQPAATHLI